MDAPALTPTGRQFVEAHECNAYCRGAHHCELVWLNPARPDAAQAAREMFTGAGISLLALEPAYEAPPLGQEARHGWSPEAGYEGSYVVAGDWEGRLAFQRW